MPYIKASSRSRLDKPLEVLSGLVDSRGDLNYCITALVSAQVKAVGYAAIEQAIGVLECAKLEFYRRVAAPYEDRKCQENGDVYFAEDIVQTVTGDDPRLNKATGVAP